MSKKAEKPKKLLIARLGAGSITVALCAALPGCNLALAHTNCSGDPGSRGMATVDCPDAQAYDTGAAQDALSDAVNNDSAHDGTGGPAGDAASDHGSGDLL